MKNKPKKEIKGKKGISTTDVLKEVIIILLIVVILAFILSNVYTQYAKYIDLESCRDSIKANANARIVLKGTDMTTKWGQVTQLKCTTQYEKIATKNEEQKKRALAESIDQCWSLYGKDGYELFDTKDNTYCVVCSRLDFDDKKLITNLTGFLMTEKKEGKTYFERLYEREPVPELAGAETVLSEEYSTEAPLGVVFLMAKEGYIGQGQATAVSIGTGAAVGATLIGIGFVLTATGVMAPIGIPLIGTTATVMGSLSLAAAVGTATAVSAGTVAYNVASDHSADFDSMIMITPYDNIKSLNCTYLEGSPTGLEVIEKEA